MTVRDFDWCGLCRDEACRKLLFGIASEVFERTHPSTLEQKLIISTVYTDKKAEELRKRYQEMRDGLETLAQSGEIKFLDASRLFDAERARTFSDAWHFSDPGHEILGKAIAPVLAEMLRSRRSKAAAER